MTQTIHRAPRVKLDFDDKGRPIVHGGSGAGYSRGCRCEECTEANTIRYREAYNRRHRMLLRNPECVEHGRVSTYVNWGCKCDECKEAHSEYMKQPDHKETARRSAARRKAGQRRKEAVVIPLEDRL